MKKAEKTAIPNQNCLYCLNNFLCRFWNDTEEKIVELLEEIAQINQEDLKNEDQFLAKLEELSKLPGKLIGGKCDFFIACVCDECKAKAERLEQLEDTMLVNTSKKVH